MTEDTNQKKRTPKPSEAPIPTIHIKNQTEEVKRPLNTPIATIRLKGSHDGKEIFTGNKLTGCEFTGSKVTEKKKTN